MNRTVGYQVIVFALFPLLVDRMIFLDSLIYVLLRLPLIPKYWGLAISLGHYGLQEHVQVAGETV